jgi:hypothetical protein
MYACELQPGDTYQATDGVQHVVAEVWTTHQTFLTHADGTSRKLFNHALVWSL